MCYNFDNKGVNLRKAIEDFDGEEYHHEFETRGSINAFVKGESPYIPAIVNHNGIVLMNTFWGVQEHPDAPTKGKNLQSEKTHSLYRKIEKNRCLIPASSYFEHKTILVPGKKTPVKQKHKMYWDGIDQFYIAAYYDIYKNGDIGFGLITTIPNPIQAEIHNRMIITLDIPAGRDFLSHKPIEEFQFPNYSPRLQYSNLEPEKTPNLLF